MKICYTFFLLNLGSFIWAQNSFYSDLLIDNDQDGVADYLDKCKGTPLGARVDGSGCALDIDMDGIIDLDDNCVSVSGIGNLQGCPDPYEGKERGYDNFRNIVFSEFENDISERELISIKKVAEIINKYGKDLVFLVEGHANDYSDEKKNLKLSLERAEEVKNQMLIFDVNPKQIVIKGEGSKELRYPECADINLCKENGNDWKNEENRRVVFRVLKTNHNEKP